MFELARVSAARTADARQIDRPIVIRPPFAFAVYAAESLFDTL
jgi:hypothetical protein